MYTKKHLVLVDLKKTDYNAKIPSISGLATSAIIANVSNLVKKKDYDAKILEIQSNYITTADCNKFTKNILANNIKSKGFLDKFYIAGFINNIELNKKVATLATKARLKADQDKIIKLQAFDSSYI